MSISHGTFNDILMLVNVFLSLKNNTSQNSTAENFGFLAADDHNE